MNRFKKLGVTFIRLYIFWILIFDFQRILFSIHNPDKVFSNGFWEWLQSFFFSLRLDLAMASFLSVIPFAIYCFYLVFQKKYLFYLFGFIVFLLLLPVCLIHAGEINAYTEWNSKLTARVFVNLIHPDEVVRTADYGMTFWFFIYSTIEFVFGIKLFKGLFQKRTLTPFKRKILSSIAVFIPILPIAIGLQFLLARGGWQQIPINIDAANYSNNYVLNDLSINSTYFFGKNFLLYQRGDIGQYLSKYDSTEIHQLLHDFYTYDKRSEFEILTNKRPNIVFVILESWTAKVSAKITGEKGASPEFDRLASEGILFTNIYSASTTSEVGNSTILSGYPALPEIFITMQPAKHRKLKAISQTLNEKGYSSGYYFGGDLNYGNIHSYIAEHQFERIHDEKDFPSNLKRGKLNFYDQDLFRYFLKEINQQKQPFLECAFTGSTHSPYDCPSPKKGKKWKGQEADFMNSVMYSDECIADFIKKAKKESWYHNTLFVFVADHGHASPYEANPSSTEFYHIPLLFYGDVLKEEVRGKIIDKIGSQADIVQTLLQQMDISTNDYPWSKNLLSKDVPQFALHAMSRGFGWVSPEGKFTYHFDFQKYLHNTFTDEKALAKERKRCNAFMQLLYEQYLKL